MLRNSFMRSLCLPCIVIVITGSLFLHRDAAEEMNIVQDDLTNNNHQEETNSNSNSNTNSFLLALRESRGFFDDIDETRWNRMKDRFQSTRPNEYRNGKSKEYVYHANHPKVYWVENFDPEFTCENEKKIGRFGDGGKWICDTHRIKKTDCLVYSVGSRGEFSFEKDIRTKLDCEVHTFDRDSHFNKKNFKTIAESMGVTFHHTSLGSATEKVPNGKRFKEIITDLNHEGKTIDIMKIDCEGCEWDQYLEWFDDWKETNVTIRQLIIEVHKSPLPQTPDFFHKLREQGFVIFHKEANQFDTECIEYAFLLLHPDFQRKVENVESVKVD